MCREWSVIDLKGYFIQKDFHTLGAPKDWQELIKIQQASGFSEPNVKQSKMFVVCDNRRILKITKSTTETSKFHRVP